MYHWVSELGHRHRGDRALTALAPDQFPFVAGELLAEVPWMVLGGTLAFVIWYFISFPVGIATNPQHAGESSSPASRGAALTEAPSRPDVGPPRALPVLVPGVRIHGRCHRRHGAASRCVFLPSSPRRPQTSDRARPPASSHQPDLPRNLRCFLRCFSPFQSNNSLLEILALLPQCVLPSSSQACLPP